ncbi:MAG: hypothetical protein GY815_05815 [Gammaproteobacteria bacterium]|nr:hypothetical protein [Gammaproteobacteria bacterium]
MKNFLSHSILVLLLPMLILAWGQAAAANHAYEFHADDGMRHATRGAVENAYGYMYALTDKKGHGAISVMFSNGNRLQAAQFNARVKFVDARGSVIKEEHFTQRIAAAGRDGAVERKLVRAISLSGFDSIEVDFYLTDALQSSVSAAAATAGLQPSSGHSIVAF